MEVCDIVQETGFKTIPKKKKCKKKKKKTIWLSEEALQIAVKRRESKSKGEKERYTHLNAEFQRIAPDREAALAWASLAQRFPASSVLAREGAGCGSLEPLPSAQSLAQ